jgi:hypothetical protein
VTSAAYLPPKRIVIQAIAASVYDLGGQIQLQTAYGAATAQNQLGPMPLYPSMGLQRRNGEDSGFHFSFIRSSIKAMTLSYAVINEP